MDIIDINMGCLVKKVVGGLVGLVFMWDENYVMWFIEVVVGVVDILVIFKMWIGWDENNCNVLLLVFKVEEVGIVMIMVYGCICC